MSRTISAAIVAAVSAAAVIAPAGAAFASSAAINDSVNDTWENVWDEETQTSSWEDSGSYDNIDVDRVVVSHSDRRIEIKVKYAALKKTGPNFYAFGILRFDEGKSWMLGVDTADGPDGWDTHGFAMPHGAQSGRGDAPCEGVKGSVNFADDVMIVSAPRSCMGNPRWVKAHVSSGGYNLNGRSWYDNAHNEGHGDSGSTDRIRKG